MNRACFGGAALCAALGAALALSGCYRPPFDADISSSARFEKGLTKISSLGPLWQNSNNYDDEWFIPDRGDNPSFGWLARYGSHNLQLSYMDSSAFRVSVGYWGLAMGEDSFVLPLSPTAISPISSIVQKGYLLLGDCQFTSLYGLEAVGMDSTITGVAQEAPAYVSVPDTSTYLFLGGSITPDSPTTDNLATAFLWDNSGTLYLVAGLTTIDTNLPLSTYAIPTGAVVYPGPKLKAGAFYGFNPANTKFYLSGYRMDDNSPYTCFWDLGLGLAPTVLSGIDKQVSAILFDGRLLARDGSTTRIYTKDGGLEANLPTGSMRFCYERNSGGIWYSVFSRTSKVQVGSDSSHVSIYAETFRVPSSSLDSLGN